MIVCIAMTINSEVLVRVGAKLACESSDQTIKTSIIITTTLLLVAQVGARRAKKQ